jgi:hypothetical protein
MAPVTQAKKQSVSAPKSSQSQISASLQARGMSMESMRGQDDVDGLTGEPGKPAKDSVQKFSRDNAKKFFTRQGATAGSKSAPAAPKKK